MDRVGLIREARFVKSPIKPITAAVAREDSAGPIASVGCRGESHNQQFRLGVAEIRDRLTPVVLVGKGSPFFTRHVTTVFS